MIDNPVFIVGIPRSGTTLLSLMLDAHSQVAIPYESNCYIRYHQNLPSFGPLAERENRRALADALLAHRCLRAWDHPVKIDEIDLDRCRGLPDIINQIGCAYARHKGKPIWGDKSPPYLHHIDTLHEMFPSARFIHIIRDGRDTALSVLKGRWWAATDFVTQLGEWGRGVAGARRAGRRLPENRYMDLRFEDLVAEPERELRKICRFLDLPFEERMVGGYAEGAQEKVGALFQSIHPHLAKPPSVAQAYKWKKSLSPADQAVAVSVAGGLLREMEYPSGVERHPLMFARKCYHLASGVMKRAYRLTYKLIFGKKRPLRGNTKGR